MSMPLCVARAEQIGDRVAVEGGDHQSEAGQHGERVEHQRQERQQQRAQEEKTSSRLVITTRAITSHAREPIAAR